MKTVQHMYLLVKKWWMAFASALGWFNTRLILTFFYLFVLSIPALILKLLRKDLLDRRFSNAETYWSKKTPLEHTSDEAKRQF